MGTRADFYVIKYDEMEWIGSIFKDGSPEKIPLDILIQVNPVMFEEKVVEFLETVLSVTASNHDKWPWPWADSRMTDYSYIFGLYPQVIAYSPEAKHYFDVLKVVQGEDLETAKLPLPVKFPIMLKAAKKHTEELLDDYGFQPTQSV
jgi:hypothetical protein